MESAVKDMDEKLQPGLSKPSSGLNIDAPLDHDFGIVHIDIGCSE